MEISRCHSFIVALTGGIACGKSKMLSILKEYGFKVFESDKIAHKCMQIDSSIYKQIISLFDKEILDENGEISRKKLGDRVFFNKRDRSKLNDIFLPVMKNKIEDWMKKCELENSYGVAEIPLLFESKLYQLSWDYIAVIYADQKVVVNRLKERGLSAFEAEKRIRSQWPIEKKCQQADILINGNNSEEYLKEKVSQLAEKWMKERGINERREKRK